MPKPPSTPWFLKPVEWFISSRYGGPIFIRLASPVDRRLVPATNGRLSVLVGQRVLVLETVGAKSGKRRRTPLAYAPDGDDLILVASYVGKPVNPAWYHNVKANPRVRVYMPGGSGWYTARDAAGDERDRAWKIACQYYSGYEKYQTRTGGRVIPVILLTPEANRQSAA